MLRERNSTDQIFFDSLLYVLHIFFAAEPNICQYKSKFFLAYAGQFWHGVRL